jgi:hypothetical protein
LLSEQELPAGLLSEQEHSAAIDRLTCVRLLSLAVVSLALAGCSGVPFTAERDESDDFRAPLVCVPKHKALPCTHGVEQGRAYEFNLATHCGIEWAYFDGRYWTSQGPQAKPPDWAGITAGKMVLQRPDFAIFHADQGGGARFVPVRGSYRPPACL